MNLIRQEYLVFAREGKEKSNTAKWLGMWIMYLGSLVFVFLLFSVFQVYLWTIRVLCRLFPSKAEKLYPVYEDAYMSLGATLAQKGEYEKARKVIEKAYKIMPQNLPPELRDSD